MEDVQQGAGAELPPDAPAPSDPPVEAPTEAIVEEAAAEGIALPADTPAPVDSPPADEPAADDEDPAKAPSGVVAKIDDLTVAAIASGNTVEHNILSWLQVHLMGAKAVLTRVEVDLETFSPEVRSIIKHFIDVL